MSWHPHLTSLPPPFCGLSFLCPLPRLLSSHPKKNFFCDRWLANCFFYRVYLDMAIVIWERRRKLPGNLEYWLSSSSYVFANTPLIVLTFEHCLAIKWLKEVRIFKFWRIRIAFKYFPLLRKELIGSYSCNNVFKLPGIFWNYFLHSSFTGNFWK